MTDTTDFFGGRKTKREVSQEIQQEIIERTADRFPDRSPHRPPPKRRRGTTEQLHNFTMRLSVNDAEKFIRWCEKERLSYREGFARLVERIG